MADPVVIGIIGSTLVTPSVVAFYALSRQRAEFRETRRRELRDLLDEGARAITQALRAHEDMPWEWSIGVMPPEDRAVEIVAARRATIERARHVKDRLLIRLPEDHPVVSAFEEATVALDGFKPINRAYEQRRDWMPHREAFYTARQTVLDARRGYLAAARAIEG